MKRRSRDIKRTKLSRSSRTIEHPRSKSHLYLEVQAACDAGRGTVFPWVMNLNMIALGLYVRSFSPIVTFNCSADIMSFQGIDRSNVSHKLCQWRPQRTKTMIGLLAVVSICSTDESLTCEYSVRFTRFSSAVARLMVAQKCANEETDGAYSLCNPS